MDLGKRRKDGWRIDPLKIALVVIDMQRGFVDEAAPLRCIGGAALVPKINQLAATCRALQIPVIFVKADRRADLSDSGLILDFGYWKQDEEMDLIQGRKGNEFCEGLDISKSDYIVPKIRYSAFIQGSSTIELLLRGLSKDQIIICGIATDVCVGMSAVDAMMLGFKVFFVSALTATFTEARQRMALEIYDRHFAKVISFEEVMNELSNRSDGRRI